MYSKRNTSNFFLYSVDSLVFTGTQMSEADRRSVLLSFYRSVVGKLWPLPPGPSTDENNG